MSSKTQLAKLAPTTLIFRERRCDYGSKKEEKKKNHTVIKFAEKVVSATQSGSPVEGYAEGRSVNASVFFTLSLPS
jgi:hypothetical protein